MAALLSLSSALPLDGQTRVPVRTREVQFRGIIRPQTRDARAELRAFVATPFGKIPVTGYSRLTYTCAGHFAGTIDYHAIIRMLAHLKGIDLVTRIEGHVGQERRAECGTGPDISINGRATTDSFTVTGWVRTATDSVAFRGTTWFDGAVHHGDIASIGSETRLAASYRMSSPARARQQVSQTQ